MPVRISRQYIISINPERWTIGAIKCYQRGCVCSGCFIHETYKQTLGRQCMMKKSVMMLVQKFGVPEDFDFENFIDIDD